MTTLRDGATAPSTSFPLLPLRTGVLFPGTIVTLPIGRERSIALVKEVRRGDILGVTTQKDPSISDPGGDDLHPVGTFARVVEVARLPNGDHRLSLEGLGRMRMTALVRRDPFWLAEGTVIEETGGKSSEAELFARALGEQVRELSQGGGSLAQAGG